MTGATGATDAAVAIGTAGIGRKAVGGLSCMSMDTCEASTGVASLYISGRGTEAGIEAVIEIVVVGTAGSGCLTATSESSSI